MLARAPLGAKRTRDLVPQSGSLMTSIKEEIVSQRVVCFLGMALLVAGAGCGKGGGGGGGAGAGSSCTSDNSCNTGLVCDGMTHTCVPPGPDLGKPPPDLVMAMGLCPGATVFSEDAGDHGTQAKAQQVNAPANGAG